MRVGLAHEGSRSRKHRLGIYWEFINTLFFHSVCINDKVLFTVFLFQKLLTISCSNHSFSLEVFIVICSIYVFEFSLFYIKSCMCISFKRLILRKKWFNVIFKDLHIDTTHIKVWWFFIVSLPCIDLGIFLYFCINKIKWFAEDI